MARAFVTRASTTATRFCLRHRSSPMSCSDCWMLLDIWSRTQASTIIDCHGYFTKICTGWVCLSECSTSLLWPSKRVSGVKHQCTSLIIASRSCLRRCRSSSAISRCPSTICTTCSSQHVWFLCLRFCRFNSLEHCCLNVCATLLLGTTGFDVTWKRSCLLSCCISRFGTRKHLHAKSPSFHSRGTSNLYSRHFDCTSYVSIMWQNFDNFGWATTTSVLPKKWETTAVK